MFGWALLLLLGLFGSLAAVVERLRVGTLV